MPRTTADRPQSENVFYRVFKLWVAGAAVCSGNRAAARTFDAWGPGASLPPLPILPRQHLGLTSPAPSPSAGRGMLAASARPPSRTGSDQANTFLDYDPDACEPTPNFSPCWIYADRPQPEPQLAVKSILGRLVWRLCETNACGSFTGRYAPRAQLTLTYSFDMESVLRSQNMTPFDAPRRAVVDTVLRDIEQFIHLRFVQTDDARAHIVYGEAGEDSLGALVQGQTRLLEANLSAVLLTRGDALDVMTVAHETLHALGLVHPFSGEGLDRVRLQPQPRADTPWVGDKSATILSYYAPPVWQGMESVHDGRLAPLDFTALAYRYQTSPRLAGETQHVFDENFGVGSVHDDLGRNALKAEGLGPAYLTLRTDGSTSLLNDTQVLRLSATSVFVRGDIRETGGTLQGNDWDNHLIGSADDDVIETGAGNNHITTGGGRDVIIVSRDAKRVHVHDFDPEGTQIAFEGEPSVSVDAPSRRGLVLRAETGAEVLLGNVTAFDRDRSLVKRAALPRGQVLPLAPPPMQASSAEAPPLVQEIPSGAP